jgi:hypothetical protein
VGAAAGVDPATSHGLAWRAMSGQLNAQAMVLAYNDVFWILRLAFVGFLPFIFLLGGKTKHEGPPAH